MKKACLLITLLTLLAVPVISHAQDASKIMQLKNQIVDLQNQGKLGFKDFTLCSKISGFGSYVPLDKPVLKSGAELLVYYEPLNLFTNRVQGMYENRFTQDMILLSGDGKKVMYEKKDAVNMYNKTKTPVFDWFVKNKLTLTGAEPGEYVYKVVLKDKLKPDAVATKTIKFQIVK